MSGITEILPVAWYVSRASGIAAFILLTIVVVNGLLISTRIVARFLPPALNYEMHHFFSWNALLFVVIHFTSLLFDPYFHMLPSEALIPFLLERDYLSLSGFDLRYAVGFGILAFYGIVFLILTSQFRRKIPLKVWRASHYVSFATYFLFLAHGFTSGSDSKTWWMIWLYLLSLSLVSLLVGIRVFYAIRKRALTQALS